MIVTIHQPQYLPWIPYFLKIAESDLFIILDSVAFQKNGLQNRNQIKTAQGAQWLTVPVRHDFGQRICEVKIDNSINWRKKHWLAISQSYSKAQAFACYADELASIFRKDWDFLVDLNICLLEKMLEWMNIKTVLLRSSRMQAQGKGSELVLNLCREVRASRYIAGLGGSSYLDNEAFEAAAIQVQYRPPLFAHAYPQQYPRIGFLNDLSALDVLLNCGSSWKEMLGER